jgi:peroxiredoxin
MRLRTWAGFILALTLPVMAGAEALPGNTAPDFTLPASDGKTYHLKDYRGRYVVLEWFNNACPFIRKHYDSGNMQKLQQTYGNKGVIWFSIASSAPGKEGYMTDREAVKIRVDNKAASMATLLDGDTKVAAKYGAKTTPHMFVINPKGKVIYAGAIDDHNSADPADIPNSKNYVATALDEAMAGKAVSTPSTPPYGCSVKYKS